MNYSDFDIIDPILIDNTGAWRDTQGLKKHLDAGASKVGLTAPGKGDMKNIVYGINDHNLDSKDNLVSAASCTTNAIVPVLKIVNDEFAIENGHIEAVHAYTNDQNLIDNYQRGDRRGKKCSIKHGDNFYWCC